MSDDDYCTYSEALANVLEKVPIGFDVAAFANPLLMLPDGPKAFSFVTVRSGFCISIAAIFEVAALMIFNPLTLY